MNMKEDNTVPDAAIESLVAEIVEDFLQQLDCGEQPEIEVYAQRYPQVADVLRKVLSTLRVMRTISVGAGSTGGMADVGTSIGGTLGDFRLVREIGRGGMGVVYEAEQISLDRRVALKVLPFASVLDDRQLQRFKNEAQAAAQLHHTNIVPVFSVGCTRGVHYYAMQFVEGHTLSNVIRELRQLSGLDTEQPKSGNGSISQLVQDLTSGHFTQIKQATADDSSSGQAAPDETATSALGVVANELSTKSQEFFRSVANLGVQAAEALEYAHSNGIIHRDIKPSNLLLDVKGTLWITDFGLAHFRSDTGLTLTMSGDLLGTIRYMSSEQALGKHVYLDHRTDIYSLGVTMYELLTLQPAFTGRNRQQLLRQIADEEPRSLRRLNEAIPVDLETIVLKAMAKDAQVRYESAQELSDDLRRFLQDKPIKARRPTLAQRAAKWSRRHRSVVGAAVVVLVMAVVALSISTVMIWREQVKTQRALTRSALNFQKARDAVDEMIRISGQFDNPPRMENIQRELLQKAQIFYEGILKENSEDQAVRQETGEAYGQVGNIYDFLGYYEQAQQAYLNAIDVFENLADDFPNVGDYREKIVLIHHNRLVKVLGTLGRHEEAIEACLQAVIVAEKLVADFPDFPQYRSDLADAHLWLGNALSNVGPFDRAEQAHSQAIEIRGNLVSEFPSKAQYRQALAYDCRELGWMLWCADQRRKALQVYGRARDLLVELAFEFSTVPEYEGDLAKIYWHLGIILGLMDRPAEGVQACRQAEGLLEKLVADVPVKIHYSSTLAYVHDNIGKGLRKMGQPEEGVAALQQAVALAEKLVADFPSVPNYRVQLAFHRINLGAVMCNAGRLEEAEQIIRQGVELQEELVAEFPDVSRHWLELSQHHIELGAVLSQIGRLDESAQVFRQAMELREKLLADFPDVLEYSVELYRAHSRLGNVLKKAGKFQEAEQEWRHAIELNEKLAADFPDVPEYKVRLANSRGELAGVLSRVGKGQEAEQEYRKLEQFCEKQVADFPNMHDSWACLGSINLRLRQWDKMATSYSKAIGLNPERVRYWHERGYAYMQLGQWDKVIADYTKAMSLEPGNGEHWKRRGKAYNELGQFERATLDFLKAAELKPNDAPIWYWQALAQLGAGQIEEYHETCAAMLQRFGQTEDPSSANWVAWTCVLLPETVKDLDKVVLLAEKAAESEETNGGYHQTLGAVLYRAGRFDESIEKLNELTAYTSTWFFMAMAHHKLGHFDESRKWLDQAVKRTEEIQDTITWSGRLTLQLLRQEAELLIGQSEQTTPDGEEVVPVEDK